MLKQKYITAAIIVSTKSKCEELTRNSFAVGFIIVTRQLSIPWLCMTAPALRIWYACSQDFKVSRSTTLDDITNFIVGTQLFQASIASSINQFNHPKRWNSDIQRESIAEPVWTVTAITYCTNHKLRWYRQHVVTLKTKVWTLVAETSKIQHRLVGLCFQTSISLLVSLPPRNLTILVVGQDGRLVEEKSQMEFHAPHRILTVHKQCMQGSHFMKNKIKLFDITVLWKDYLFTSIILSNHI